MLWDLRSSIQPKYHSIELQFFRGQSFLMSPGFSHQKHVNGVSLQLSEEFPLDFGNDGGTASSSNLPRTNSDSVSLIVLP